jgi:hypothetical protein
MMCRTCLMIQSFIHFETKALSRGAEILGETFIFFVSGAIVVYEYHRSSEKEKKMEAQRLQQIRDDASVLQAKLVSLDKRLEALEEYAKANRKSILGLGIGANYVDPENTVPINDTAEHINKQVVSQQLAPTSNQDTKPTRTNRWFWPF